MNSKLSTLWLRFRYGTLHRAWEIFSDAPWSNHDLLVAVSLLLIGVALLVNPSALYNLRAMAYLANQGNADQWGIGFLGIGFLNMAVALWCKAPPFWIRLLARMAGAFAFLTLAFSTMMFQILIPPTMVYMAIAIWSFCGILRTKSSGR